MAKIEHEQAQDVWACGLVAMCILGENLDPLGLKQCSSLAEKELKKKDAMFTMAVWIEEHLRQAAENIENEVSGSASGKGKEKDDGTEEDHTIQEREPDFEILQRVSAIRSEWKTVAYRDGCKIADIPLNTLSISSQKRLKSIVLADIFLEISDNTKPDWDLVSPLTDLWFKNEPAVFDYLPLSLKIPTWPYLVALAEQVDAPTRLQHFIGSCYLDGGNFIKQDISEGLEWFVKAAQNVGVNQMEQVQALQQDEQCDGF